MSSSRSAQQTWDASRGIVFASGNRAACSHPPSARSFTTQVATSVPSSTPLLHPGAALAGGDDRESSASVVTTQDGVKEGVKEEPTEDDDAPAPFTPLDFKIPEDKFRNAKKADEGTPESYWTYNLYRRLSEDGVSVEGVKVHYCQTSHTTERVLQQYFAHEKVLGFDMEWDPDGWKAMGNARRNVSVVQLASESRVGIFHLALFPLKESLATPTLRKIMEDPDTTKLGVWIKGDAARMEKYLKIQSRGIFELSHLFKLVRYSASGRYSEINKKLVSLANLTKDVLGLPMFKGDKVRSSDWSQKLRMDQIIYGASDAYAAIQIFAVLNHEREQLDPVPPLPFHAELNKPIRLGEGVVVRPVIEDEGCPPEEGTTDGSGLSVKQIKAAADTINVETDDPSTTPKSRSAKRQKLPSDPRIQEAQLWASQYRIANPETPIALACLRTYYLWHKNQDLDPVKIAALLRDPPLAIMTVAMYVAEAIVKENFPVDKARLVSEVLPLFKGYTTGPRGKRHFALVKLCQEDTDDGAVVATSSEETVGLRIAEETAKLKLSDDERTAELEYWEETVDIEVSKQTTVKEH
ncbi:putative 3-5 exonuclease helicase [Cladorrhinum sp. PSN259]|nr:putative 3-5 exonuclease helicase [Cladorrhinum sp. PSN259]